MSLCCGRRNAAHKSAFVKSSALRWIVGDLRFKDSLPHPNYIQRLVEHFRETLSPESMRRVVFSPEKILCEYASASCHLPGAYVEFFPCLHCTYTDDNRFFVEVFHFPNVHDPNVCATATFIMPADPRVALQVHTDIFIEVLRFLPRSELEKALLVSAAGRTEGPRAVFDNGEFYGESNGMLSVHFLTRSLQAPWRILRVLTPRGFSQALNIVRSHLRNALVDVFPFFKDSVPAPGPPREMVVDIPLRTIIGLLKSFLRSRPLNSEFRSWCAADYVAGFGHLPTLARRVLKPHKKLRPVQKLELGLFADDASWPQLAGLLNQPGIREFPEITISTTKVAIDVSELRAILSSWQSPKMHVIVSSSVEPQDAILTLPAQIIGDFLAPQNYTNFIAEFSLFLGTAHNVAFSEMPNVDNATNRRKRFRYHIQGKDTVVRMNVYKNRTNRKNLTVVTFDHWPRAILFLNGNVCTCV